MVMNSNCLMVLNQDSGYLVNEMTQLLTQRGIGVTRSFDLQATRAVHNGCACPHHGTSECTCQLMVMLIYKKDEPPITLVLEGRDGHTWISLVYTPGQNMDARLIDLIAQALRFANDKLAPAGRIFQEDVRERGDQDLIGKRDWNNL